MAQWINRLPLKHEDLSVSFGTYVKKSQAWRYTLVVLSLGKQKQGDPWGLWTSHTGPIAELQGSERSSLKEVDEEDT